MRSFKEEPSEISIEEENSRLLELVMQRNDEINSLKADILRNHQKIESLQGVLIHFDALKILSQSGILRTLQLESKEIEDLLRGILTTVLRFEQIKLKAQ